MNALQTNYLNIAHSACWWACGGAHSNACWWACCGAHSNACRSRDIYFCSYCGAPKPWSIKSLHNSIHISHPFIEEYLCHWSRASLFPNNIHFQHICSCFRSMIFQFPPWCRDIKIPYKHTVYIASILLLWLCTSTLCSRWKLFRGPYRKLRACLFLDFLLQLSQYTDLAKLLRWQKLPVYPYRKKMSSALLTYTY